MAIKYSTFHISHVLLMALAVVLIVAVNFIEFYFLTQWIILGHLVLGIAGVSAVIWAITIQNIVIAQGFAYWNKNINMDVSKTGIEVQTTSGSQKPP